ncbi:MAG: ATP-binding protein [Kiloniellales bacterium]
MQVLDSPAEEAFDEITACVAQQIEAPIAVITLLDDKRQWFKSCYGLDIAETSRDVAFCAHALASVEPLIVEDTTVDGRFADNPLVTMTEGLRSYCGAPLVLPGGVVLGTLCVVDVTPRRFAPEHVGLLTSLARVVVQLLQLRLAAKQVWEQERASTLAAKSETAERKAELRASEERLRDVSENLPGLVYQFQIDGDGRQSIPYVSGTVSKILGLAARDVVRDASLLRSQVHPDDIESFDRSIAEARDRLDSWHWEGRLLRADGAFGWFRGSSSKRVLDCGGVLWNCLLLDITEWRQVEERLRQSQKMEAIGQLTGGVAHDFNNLLAVVQGNAEMLADRLGENDTAVRAILRVSERGSQLTQRLLAFSRQQSLNPKTVDLAALICGMTEWLRRLLGSNIVISACAEPDLWAAVVDPFEVENVVLNLALNARDAMPSGGQLCITLNNTTLSPDSAPDSAPDSTPDFAPDFAPDAADVRSGDFVRLSVRDCGIGMSQAVKARAFEPFFTTKAVGEGSGLGLSMAYGFARQSGGHIVIDSEECTGTEVTLYLPKAESADAVPVAKTAATPGAGRGERILLLEDNDDVRQMVERMLIASGYRVTAVADVASARRALEAVEEFKLLLSDIMLPGEVDGLRFAAEATQRYPALKVVFVSGYAADALNGKRAVPPGATVLRKPFQQRTLSRALRDALDKTVPVG